MNSNGHNSKLSQINKNKQNCSPRYGQLIKEINDIQILPYNSRIMKSIKSANVHINSVDQTLSSKEGITAMS
jgi:hypothetical protein